MSKTNSVRLIGIFGQDPKTHTTEAGILISSFSFATHEKRKNASEQWVESTDWHNVVAFGKVAQLVSTHMKKGAKCSIDGRIQTRQYIDKDSNTRYVTEIVLEEILFLSPAPNSQGTTNPAH
jgi:single-strand DNA-binding protein